MLIDIPIEELGRTLDEVAAGALSQAGIAEPPIDALGLAQRLGLAVAWDDRQTGRARLVQLAGEQSRENWRRCSCGTIHGTNGCSGRSHTRWGSCWPKRCLRN